jgi:signal transduction histidine kinase/ligand-binding sensor domain-containing protein
MKIKPYFAIPVKLLVLFIFLFYFPAQSIRSQEVIIHKVPFDSDRNIDFITGITQDQNGLIWFSSKAGLISYDGNTMSFYKNDPINPNSLSSNQTESIYADQGKIWIGTLGAGLDLYDPASGLFTHFKYDPDNPLSLSNDTVTQILKDSQGILWIGTHGGLNQFDPTTGQFMHFRNEPGNPKSISDNQVRALYEDSSGTLWVGTGSPYADNGGGPLSGGLNRLDRASRTFKQYLYDPENPNGLLNNKISAIYEDDQGVLWIGTKTLGLHTLNREKDMVERVLFDPKNPDMISIPEDLPGFFDYEHITFIKQDNAGGMWIGTVSSGVFYFDPNSDKRFHYGRYSEITSEIADDGVWSAFTSRDGIFWLGGMNGNIYRINPSPRKIQFVNTPAGVTDFYMTKDGDLWIATEDKIQIKKNNGTSEVREMDITPDYVADNHVEAMLEDKQGNLWISDSGGLVMWDPENEKLIRYENDPDDENSLSNNTIITIYEDNDENLWLGTLDGLNLMNRKDGSFKTYYMNKEATSYIGLNIVTSVVQDNHGIYWVGTWNTGGIFAFDPDQNTTKQYLSGTSITNVFEDEKKEIWLGGSSGLFRYDFDADDFVRYLDPFTTSGIPMVYAIEEDNEGYLWISTQSELARINPERNETSRLRKAYGLGKSNFKFISSYKDQNGKLYFGDNAGYYVFDPSEVIFETDKPDIVITGFRLANTVVKPGPDGPFKQNLLDVEEIKLSYNENIFSFDYALIDYVNPEENQLNYILENYDVNWRQPNSEQRAYYFNVPPGKYIFRIKGANSYGVWSEKKIRLTILPPPWKTWWAYSFYILVVALFIFGIDRFQRRRIREIERKKNYQRELEQAKEIEKAYLELKNTQKQLIHAEKMASLGELTAGIAHEIQNPLNFVNNFSELSVDMIDELTEEMEKGNQDEINILKKDLKQNLEKINQHGRRASSIVKGMLEHSRSGNNEKQPFDINLLADEYLRLAYHGLRAKDKSFQSDYKLDADESLPKVNVVSQEIGRVLLNLINNAFYAVAEKAKHSKTDYNPAVIVTTKNLDNNVEITLKDNGNGIPDEIKNKIFQPFFTTKPTGQGTGLGLSMSYDIITKGHGGNLTMESREGEGTKFIITLPANSINRKV